MHNVKNCLHFIGKQYFISYGDKVNLKYVLFQALSISFFRRTATNSSSLEIVHGVIVANLVGHPFQLLQGRKGQNMHLGHL